VLACLCECLLACVCASVIPSFPRSLRPRAGLRPDFRPQATLQMLAGACGVIYCLNESLLPNFVASSLAPFGNWGYSAGTLSLAAYAVMLFGMRWAKSYPAAAAVIPYVDFVRRFFVLSLSIACAKPPSQHYQRVTISHTLRCANPGRSIQPCPSS
jgi:hypothetical protein